MGSATWEAGADWSHMRWPGPYAPGLPRPRELGCEVPTPFGAQPILKASSKRGSGQWLQCLQGDCRAGSQSFTITQRACPPS